MHKKAFLIILSVLVATIAISQDLTGYWRGKVVMAPGACFPVYNIELQITDSAGVLKGSAYHYSDNNNFVRQKFEGVYIADSLVAHIKETGILDFKLKPSCVPCTKTYRLTFHKNDALTEQQLRGRWTGVPTDSVTTCDPGTIVLQRFEKSDFAAKPPKEIAERENTIDNTVYVDTGMVKLDFYDNGTVDGDIISVFVNNKNVINNQMLNTTAVTSYIHVTALERVHDVLMVAHNLGTIPPNTALVIVTAGDKRHQVNLSSDLKKNAGIKIVYDKEKAAKR